MIDAGGFEQPALGSGEIAAHFGIEAQADARRGGGGSDPRDFFEQRPWVAAIVFNLQRLLGEIGGVARSELDRSGDALSGSAAKLRVGAAQSNGEPCGDRQRE